MVFRFHTLNICPLKHLDKTSCYVVRLLTEPGLLGYWSSPSELPFFHQTQYEFFKSCVKGWYTAICLLTAKNCVVRIYINALKTTTMLRSLQCEISWHTITLPNNVVERLYYIENPSKASSGVKEDFVIYLVSQAWKSFNLFYCNLTDCICKMFWRGCLLLVYTAIYCMHINNTIMW